MNRNNSVFFLAVLCVLAASCSAGAGNSHEEQPQENDASAESSVLGYLNGLPALIDLGSHGCVPCDMMVGELDRLDSTTGDQLDVQFIDINRNSEAASDFGIRVIPTQVFFSENGEELYRHEGYISYDDMMAKWVELGYTFE